MVENFQDWFFNQFLFDIHFKYAFCLLTLKNTISREKGNPKTAIIRKGLSGVSLRILFGSKILCKNCCKNKKKKIITT